MADRLAVPEDLERWLRLSREGNARSWTYRLAHGLTDFVLDFARKESGPLELCFENADQADPADREFFSVLTSRAEPELVRIEFITGLAGANESESDPALVLDASTRCMHLACYESARDWSMRGREMVQDGRYARFTRNLLFASLLLGNYAEVEALCAEAMERIADPALQAHAAYAHAILHARLYGPARRDLEAARHWIGKALALTEKLPACDEQAVNLAFLRNTLALIEMRSGRYEEALELLNAGLDFIARHAPDKFDEECVLLFHNRARLNTAWGRPKAAIEDLTALLRHQPGMGEAYLDRGILHRGAGRREEALRDFDSAIAWSPPYPEARVNRACLHFECGQADAARADVDAGLRISPEHARLICLRGLLELGQGASESAFESFTEAIRLEPGLADAWANRATVRFRNGDAEGALADLNAALGLREDPVALHNRARVLESQREPSA